MIEQDVELLKQLLIEHKKTGDGQTLRRTCELLNVISSQLDGKPFNSFMTSSGLCDIVKPAELGRRKSLGGYSTCALDKIFDEVKGRFTSVAGIYGAFDVVAFRVDPLRNFSDFSRKSIKPGKLPAPKPAKKVKSRLINMRVVSPFITNPATFKVLEKCDKLPVKVRRELRGDLTPWGFIVESARNGLMGETDRLFALNRHKEPPLYWAHPWLVPGTGMHDLSINSTNMPMLTSEWLDFLGDHGDAARADPTTVDDLFSRFRHAKRDVGVKIDDLISALPEGEREVVTFSVRLWPVRNPTYSYKELEGAIWLFMEERFRINSRDQTNSREIKVEIMHLRHFVNDLEYCYFDRVQNPDKGFLQAFRDVINAYQANPGAQSTYRPRVNVQGQTQD